MRGLSLPRAALSDRSRVGGLALVIFVLSAARLPSTFLYPSFWAEDGAVFFRDSIERGLPSLWTPIAGMHMAIPRLIALLALAFPVRWTPTVYAVCAGMLSSVSLALFSRSGLRWLVPQNGLRAVLCVVFALVPGTTECLFALCILTYTLFVGALFLLLERDGQGVWQMGWRRSALLSFLWFSIGQGVVLAPLLLYLYVRTRNRNYLLCLAALAVSVGLNLVSVNSFAATDPVSVPLLVMVLADNAFVRLVYLPLLGISRLGPILQLSAPAFLLLSTVALMALVYVFGRLRPIDAEGARVLALALVSATMALVVTVVARYYAVSVLLRPDVRLDLRYSLAPSILALILGYAILAPALALHTWRLAAGVLLGWLTLNVLREPLYRAPVPFLPFAREWPGQAAQIQEALDQRRAGTLRGTVVVRDIWCRPGPPSWVVRELKIAP